MQRINLNSKLITLAAWLLAQTICSLNTSAQAQTPAPGTDGSYEFPIVNLGAQWLYFNRNEAGNLTYPIVQKVTSTNLNYWHRIPEYPPAGRSFTTLGWKTGQAPFGFGSTELPYVTDLSLPANINNTPVSGGSVNRRTYYFRYDFTIDKTQKEFLKIFSANPNANPDPVYLYINLFRDDAHDIYINGTRVDSSNVYTGLESPNYFPDGGDDRNNESSEITELIAKTDAQTSLNKVEGVMEKLPITRAFLQTEAIDLEKLNFKSTTSSPPGKNTVVVEIHRYGQNDDDLYFDAEMKFVGQNPSKTINKLPRFGQIEVGAKAIFQNLSVTQTSSTTAITRRDKSNILSNEAGKYNDFYETNTDIDFSFNKISGIVGPANEDLTAEVSFPPERPGAESNKSLLFNSNTEDCYVVSEFIDLRRHKDIKLSFKARASAPQSEPFNPNDKLEIRVQTSDDGFWPNSPNPLLQQIGKVAYNASGAASSPTTTTTRNISELSNPSEGFFKTFTVTMSQEASPKPLFPATAKSARIQLIVRAVGRNTRIFVDDIKITGTPLFPDSYDEYAQLKFPASSSEISKQANADFDGDGVANMLEYVIGSDPTLASSSTTGTGGKSYPLNPVANFNFAANAEEVHIGFRLPYGMLHEDGGSVVDVMAIDSANALNSYLTLLENEQEGINSGIVWNRSVRIRPQIFYFKPNSFDNSISEKIWYPNFANKSISEFRKLLPGPTVSSLPGLVIRQPLNDGTDSFFCAVKSFKDTTGLEPVGPLLSRSKDFMIRVLYSQIYPSELLVDDSVPDPRLNSGAYTGLWTNHVTSNGL